MKIGILTFHWAANYGAVLQTYALCNYLKNTFAADVEIINYYPRNLELTLFNALKQKKPVSVFHKLTEMKTEKYIRKFRDKLPLTRRYYTNDELIASVPDYDVIITGSDQVWNPYFLMYGEKKITPVYYLNFGKPAAKKISVSASFGCDKLPDKCGEIVKPLLGKFTGISVRENTAAAILETLGFSDVKVTADPTSLLDRQACLSLCARNAHVKKESVSKFILRHQSKKTRTLINSICSRLSGATVNNIKYLTVEEWMSAINNSKIVITNSFHCVMICLKLHTEFAAVLEDGTNAGMNDRFHTLLSFFGLENRIIRNAQELDSLEKINFADTDKKMTEYAQTLKAFIEGTIGNGQIQ